MGHGNNVSEEPPGRIYANEVTKTMTDENGTSEEITGYVFKDIEGLAYYYPMLTDSKGDPLEIDERDETITGIHSESIGSPGKEGANSTLFNKMEGTIYAVPRTTNYTLNLHRVYQSDDGRVYMEATADKTFTMENPDQAGGGFGTEMVVANAITVDGKPAKEDCTVTVNFKIVNKTTKIVVSQMDKDNKLLDSTEYEPGKMPESITPKENAEYLVVEITKENEGISREIYSRNTGEADGPGTVDADSDSDIANTGEDADTDYSGDGEYYGTAYIETFYPRDDGLCIPTETEVKW